MTIVRWEPFRELGLLQDEMNRLFTGTAAARRWMPAMDLVENEGEFVLRADLPGLTEDDIKIEFEDGTLTVSGERKSEQQSNREGYHRVERAFGSFSRSLTLPKGIDADAVSASFENGVLEVKIPKPELSKPRRIEIGAGTIEG
jgi:HSP20 family protein